MVLVLLMGLHNIDTFTFLEKLKTLYRFLINYFFQHCFVINLFHIIFIGVDS